MVKLPWDFWIKLGIVFVTSMVVGGIILHYLSEQNFKKSLERGDFDCFIGANQSTKIKQ